MGQSVVFDIGNTNITVGVFNDRQIISCSRFGSDLGRTDDEYEIQLRQVLERDNITIEPNARVVIGSVVPSLTVVFCALAERFFRSKPMQVGASLCGKILLNVPHPETVGADRIANAVAVAELYSKPALVIDFGTATTFDVVSDKGAYEGGIIAPGPETSLAALVQRTAKLPKIDLIWPTQVMGKTTETAMQSGLVLGYMALIDGLIDRLAKERGDLGKIVATGGMGAFFAAHSKYSPTYDRDLTLTGLQRIGERGIGERSHE